MPMDQLPSKVPPTAASAEDVREALVPVRMRVRGKEIIGLVDHMGNELGFPLTAVTKPDGVDVLQLPGAPRILAPRLSDRIVATLNSGASCDIALVGDSTGNGYDEWAYLWLTQALMPRLSPAVRIEYALFDDPRTRYPDPTVLQLGSATGSIQLDGTGGLICPANAVPALADLYVETGDISISNWMSTTEMSICGQFGSASASRAWQIFVQNGYLHLRWVTAGGSAVDEAVLLPWVDGAPYRFRVTLDVDNGTGGYDIKFYRSAGPGVTWVMVFSATRAGVTSIQALTNQPLEIGSRGAAAGSLSAGTSGLVPMTFSGIRVGPSIDGSSSAIISQAAFGWTYTASNVRDGAVLRFFNGSISGQNLGYLTSAQRIRQILPVGPGAVVMLSSIHNEISRSDYRESLSTARAAIDARVPDASYVFCTQTPEIAPNSVSRNVQHAERVAAGRAYATAAGWTICDTYPVFVGRDVLLNPADGKHPTSDGSKLWASIAAITI